MKENPIVVLIFCVILSIFGVCGIIDCIWTIIQHWHVDILIIFENLTIGDILRIIWWLCSFIIGAAIISVFFGDKSDL